MKFDIEAQLNKKEIDLDIHVCCSNLRHTTCFKAFPNRDQYLGYCVKKNCTLTNDQAQRLSAAQRSKMQDPN